MGWLLLSSVRNQEPPRCPCFLKPWLSPQVELVVVGDDCVLPARGIAGRRGIAGTTFVHKVLPCAAPALHRSVTTPGPF